MKKTMPNARVFGFLLIAAALIAAATAEVLHSTPRHQLKKRKPIKVFPPRAPFVPTFNWEQQEYLKAHNDMRRKLRMPPLFWSAKLTAQAHRWAEQRLGDCNYRNHSTSQQGENIYWMNYKEFTPTDVVQRWFNEFRFYDHEEHVCRCQPEREGCECGHYLNVVWSTTRRVGCSGAVYCNNQNGVFVVCQYDPAGLIPGINPFTGLSL